MQKFIFIIHDDIHYHPLVFNQKRWN